MTLCGVFNDEETLSGGVDETTLLVGDGSGGDFSARVCRDFRSALKCLQFSVDGSSRPGINGTRSGKWGRRGRYLFRSLDTCEDNVRRDGTLRT